MKNPELIPKEYDWVLSAVVGCLMIPISLIFLHYRLGVLFATLAAINVIPAADLHGIRRWLALGMVSGLIIIELLLHLLVRYQKVQLDLDQGKQNYLLTAAWLALSAWLLTRTLIIHRGKRKPLVMRQ